jgi:alanyl-tRNA synthetase
MTSLEIRQSFLDFFREKKHTIVPSSSLLPDAPNLLFTNAGMNQFVPIFLGQQKPTWNPPRVADTQKCIRAGGKHNDLEDVGLDTYHHTFFEMLGNWSFGDYFKKEAIEWAWELLVERWKFPAQRLYATVYKPGPGEPSEFDQEAHDHWANLFREADLDPAIHVLSSGKADNFWMMGDTGPCGPCSEVHVDLTTDGDTRGALVNKEDPRCIEIWNLVFIQFNAQPVAGGGDPGRMEFVPLPQRHVDTGMGFERVTAIIQGTKNFTDFSGTISNYETDIFRPIFDELEKLSGEKYSSTLPIVGRLGETPTTAGAAGVQNQTEQEKIDIAFRVIADHIRALSFAIADGITPSNEGRGYVLRRILRRAVRYGRTLGFHKPFFFKLVDVVAKTMGDVFPEVRAKHKAIKEAIRREEEAFNKTLDKGIEIFEGSADALVTIDKFIESIPAAYKALEDFILREGQSVSSSKAQQQRLWELLFAVIKVPVDFDTNRFAWESGEGVTSNRRLHAYRSLISDWQALWNTMTWGLYEACNDWANDGFTDDFFMQNVNRMQDGLARIQVEQQRAARAVGIFPGDIAFRLYDEQGFPLDLTQLMARERGLTVDVAGFEKLMEEQRSRARTAQKKETITMAGDFPPTKFVGYDRLSVRTKLLSIEGDYIGPGFSNYFAIVEESPLYAEMGGQVGDKGVIIRSGGTSKQVLDTLKRGETFFLKLGASSTPQPFVPNEVVDVRVDVERRRAIQGHHTVTHLLHWALHEIVSRDASQKGSYVGPDKLTFDFSSGPLTPEQKRDVEKLVNEKIAENAPVSWTEIPFAEAKQRKDIIQFFGEKYSDTVRVLQIGGAPHALNGYSMELCGGTHVRSTGEIGPFRIVREEAIAAGTRRIEAVAGDAAGAWGREEAARQQEKFEALARKKPDIGSLPAFESDGETVEMLKQIHARAAHLEKVDADVRDWEKKTAKAGEAELRSRAAQIANQLVASHAGKNFCVAEVANADAKLLQAVADALKPKFNGPIFLAGAKDGNVALIAVVPKELISKFQANKLIQQIAPIVGGKGGGRPESAQGAGKDPSKVAEALAKARELLS